MPETSVPSGPIIANNESTFAVSPSSNPINNKVPDWKDSNSMVALSVSISARMSPSSTESPTFLSHVATVPSSIVSLKRGIVTTMTPSGNAFESSSSELSSASSSFLESDFLGASSESLSSDFSSFLSDEPPPIKSEISSPSSPIMANNSSTLVVSPS